MIFSIPGHIDMIRKNIKTQTRRVNRGCYQEGKGYAVQEKRGEKAVPDIRIVMDDIWEEELLTSVNASDGLPIDPYISPYDARAEGNYTQENFELEFQKAYQKWDELRRWVFEFHVIGVQK